MSQNESSNGHSAAKWLQEANAFLPAAKVAELRASLAAGLREKEEQARREAERLKREREEIEGGTASATPAASARIVHRPLVTERPPPGSSVKFLVLFFAERHPGAQTSEFVSFVKENRPDINLKGVGSELYKQTQAGGRLRREGEKPESRYYLKDGKGADTP